MKKWFGVFFALCGCLLGISAAVAADDSSNPDPIPGKQVLISTQVVQNTLMTGPMGPPERNRPPRQAPDASPKLQDIHYWLFFPKSDSAKKENGYPLILFMHGIGERGTDAAKVKSIGLARKLENPKFAESFPFIAISPQCPDGCWWSPEQMFALIDQVCKQQPVDPDRIYVTGLSWGGYGTWSMTTDSPDRLAAAIPICGGGDPKFAYKAANLPIWAFHGGADPLVKVTMSENMIEAIKKAGGKQAQLTVYPGVEHDSWTRTYDDPKIYEWLLKQSISQNKKNAIEIKPPAETDEPGFPPQGPNTNNRRFNGNNNTNNGDNANNANNGDNSGNRNFNGRAPRPNRDLADNASKTYPGAEPNAAWRQEAEKRINQLRKHDLEISVVDADGNPVSDAQVSVEMLRHSFLWGTAIDARFLLSENSDSEHYRKFVEENCNAVVFENDMKWPQWDNQRSHLQIDKAMTWFEERQIVVRGHNLVWASWRWLPQSVKELQNDKEKLREAVYQHIRDEAQAYAGKIIHWDVLNEPFSEHDLMDILGNEEMVQWFKIAKEADPNARLYLNDYSILSDGENLLSPHRDHYEKTIQFLLDNKAPLEGIGLQSHFNNRLTAPEDLIKILDRYAKFGLPMAITEHDIDMQNKELQAQYTKDFLTVAFSYPAVDCIMIWGFWVNRHWRPNAAYFDKDWNLTPAGEAWMEMVKNVWWTNETTQTDANGKASFRPFLGSHRITVKTGEKENSVELVLKKGNEPQKITVSLP